MTCQMSMYASMQEVHVPDTLSCATVHLRCSVPSSSRRYGEAGPGDGHSHVPVPIQHQCGGIGGAFLERGAARTAVLSADGSTVHGSR